MRLGGMMLAGKGVRVAVDVTGSNFVVHGSKIVRKPPREEGDEGYYVRYIFEENGERKQYDTRMRQKGRG